MKATAENIMKQYGGDPSTILSIASDLEFTARELRRRVEIRRNVLSEAEKRYCEMEGIKQRDFLARKRLTGKKTKG